MKRKGGREGESRGKRKENRWKRGREIIGRNKIRGKEEKKKE